MDQIHTVQITDLHMGVLWLHAPVKLFNQRLF